MDYEYVNALKETYEKLIGKEGSKKSATSHHQHYPNGSHHVNGGGREPTARNGFGDGIRKSKIRPVDPANLRAMQGLQARCVNLGTKANNCDNRHLPPKPEGTRMINHTDSKELYNNDRNKKPFPASKPNVKSSPPAASNPTTDLRTKKQPPDDGKRKESSQPENSSKSKGEKPKNAPPTLPITEAPPPPPPPPKVKIDISEYKKRKIEGKSSPSGSDADLSQSKKKSLPARDSSYSSNKVIDFSPSATPDNKVTEYLDKKKDSKHHHHHQSSNKVIDFGEPSSESKKSKSSKPSHESHSKKPSSSSETTIDFKASKVKDGGKKTKCSDSNSPASSPSSSSSSKDGRQHSSKAVTDQQKHKHSKEHSSEKRHHSEKLKEDIKKRPSCGNMIIDFEGPSDVPEKSPKQKENQPEIIKQDDKKAKKISSAHGNKIIDFEERPEPKVKLEEKKLKNHHHDPFKKKSKSHIQNEGSNKIVDFNDTPKTFPSSSEREVEKPSDTKLKTNQLNNSSKVGNQIVDFDCSTEKKKKKHKEQLSPTGGESHKEKNLKTKDDLIREKISTKQDFSGKEHKKRPEDHADKLKELAKKEKLKEQPSKASSQDFKKKQASSPKSSQEDLFKERKPSSSPPSSTGRPSKDLKSFNLTADKIGSSKSNTKIEPLKNPIKPIKGINIPNHQSPNRDGLDKGLLKNKHSPNRDGLDKGMLKNRDNLEKGLLKNKHSPNRDNLEKGLLKNKHSPLSSGGQEKSKPDLKRKSDEMPAFAKAAKLKRLESGLLKSPPTDPIKPAILPIRAFPGLVKTTRPPTKLHPLHRDFKKFQGQQAAPSIPETTPNKSSKPPIPEKKNPPESFKTDRPSSAKKPIEKSPQSKLVPPKGAKVKRDFPEHHAFLDELNGESKDPKSLPKVPEPIRMNGQHPARALAPGGRKGPEKGHIKNLENKPPLPGRNKDVPVYVPTPKSRLTDKQGTEYDPMEQGKCFNPGTMRKSQVEYVPTKISELRGLRETSNLPYRGGPREEPYCPMPVRGMPPPGNRRIPEYYPSNKRPPPKLPPIGAYYKKMKRKRIESSDEEEYDEEMADFIDDEPVDGVEKDYSSLINGVLKEVFNYDKSRFIGVDDDDDQCMESSFFQQMKEERRSARIGLLEDLEDMKLEEEEKMREAAAKKKAAGAGGKKQRKSYGNAFIF